MNTRPPVTDWTTDFDHLDPRWIENPYPIWSELRETCPIPHTERYQGVYMPTRYADVRAVANDTEHFSSRRVVVRDDQPSDQTGGAPPITSDPPKHAEEKHLLLRPFTPAAMKSHEPRARKICRELIDRFIAKGQCDAAVDYAQELPARIIAHMLGVDENDGDLFRHWIHELLEAGITDNERMIRAHFQIGDYFQAEIEKRKREPRDDLITYLMGLELRGEPIKEIRVINTCRLLLVAGIDTTWSAIGSCLWHLATNPQDRRRLVADPALMPSAVEEFLRAYSPVTMARQIVKDTEINGCPMKEGQMVLLSFPAANRDPEVFPNADEVLIDRAQNRHAAFGLGIHRCVGSNLARMEITVALEEWLARIPEFSLRPGEPVVWSEGTVRGPRSIPVRFVG